MMADRRSKEDYVHQIVQPTIVEESKPTLVLDNSSLIQRDFTLDLMGKFKEFESLANLPVVMTQEGFDNIKLRYMGGFWVMIEFQSNISKEKFRNHIGVAWVDVEGIPLHAWTRNTFVKIAAKWGEFMYAEDIDETFLHRKRLCVKMKSEVNVFESFKVIIQGKVYWVRAKEVTGWVPDINDDEKDSNVSDDDAMENEFNEINAATGNENKRSPDPFNLYELLEKKNGETRDDENVEESPNKAKVQEENSVESGQFQQVSMPQNHRVSGSEHDKSMNFLSLNIQGLAKKAKKEWIKELCSQNNGNYAFEFDVSPSVGNSGGILCVWDPGFFRKENVTMSDYFVVLKGEWLSTSIRLMIISVYAPQELPEKMMVCATAFNSFISKGGLVDISLGGYEFTRSHRSATKMTKIKRSIEGDENGKYFHGILNISIRGILVDGDWIDDPVKVKKEFLTHFSDRFGSPCSSRLLLDDLNFPNQLTLEQKIDLESTISIEEIKRVVWDCGKDKSPGPDGFTFGFYRRYWSFIESDVIEAVQYFFQVGSFPQGCNSSFIILIPKLQDAKMVLKCFNLASGLRINMHKSKLMGVCVHSELVEGAANQVGCSTLNSSFTYLGVMVGGVMSRISMWEAIIHQVVKRLSKWKLKTLSIGGRLTLLKLVLGSIPIYHMSIFKVPMEDEVWLGDVTLKQIHLRIYALETNKLISVAEKLNHQSVVFSLRREPRGGTEHGQEIELSSRIADVVLSQMQDRWRWSLTGSGDFSVASVRKYIDDRSLPDLHSLTRWVNAVLIKVNVLAWKVSLDNLPTRLNLSIRGMEINSILCPICGAHVESMDHLMFSCSLASDLI
ncbi:RNA-directed DNA polymerase, eukaryota [Tanacetum coccineum]